MILDYDNSYYNMLINEIKILLSDLESKNEDDYLLNMLYGDLCVKEKFYIKANIFYKKAITNSNKIIDNIINKKIQDITVKVKIEELLQLIDRFKFEDCYKILKNIDNFNLDKEDSYWIGYIYNKLNENEKAIEYYEKSLDLNADFLNIFIELGLLYYKMQKIEKSLKIFERGLACWRPAQAGPRPADRPGPRRRRGRRSEPGPPSGRAGRHRRPGCHRPGRHRPGRRRPCRRCRSCRS